MLASHANRCTLYIYSEGQTKVPTFGVTQTCIKDLDLKVFIYCTTTQFRCTFSLFQYLGINTCMLLLLYIIIIIQLYEYHKDYNILMMVCELWIFFRCCEC